ncbi:MAG: LmeA family phospholipid-binding protein [Waterburya sp.]
MIGKLLSKAVKVYLRSQVEGVEDLQVKIEGKNRQILQGYIPQVFLSCDRAIYQGLHLSQVQLDGRDIAVNLSEVIKHKPLKLLEPVLVEIQLRLDAQDLQASLKANLLQSGLSDLWQLILGAQDAVQENTEKLRELRIEWQSLAIAEDQLNLTGFYQDSLGTIQQLALSTEIGLTNPHTLCLSQLTITSDSRDLLHHDLNSQLQIDLGTDVFLQEVTVASEQILCSGKIRINN